MTSVYLNQLGLLCPLGNDTETVYRRLVGGDRSGLVVSDQWHPGHPSPLGRVDAEPPALPASMAEYQCRNNQLLLAAFEQLRPAFQRLSWGLDGARIGVVLGTSTAGIDQGERVLRQWRAVRDAKVALPVTGRCCRERRLGALDVKRTGTTVA